MAATRTNEALGWRFITDEDTGDTRAVVGDCERCYAPCHRDYGSPVVSPAGIVHAAASETTLCGCDATREGWLWPQ